MKPLQAGLSYKHQIMDQQSLIDDSRTTEQIAEKVDRNMNEQENRNDFCFAYDYNQQLAIDQIKQTHLNQITDLIKSAIRQSWLTSPILIKDNPKVLKIVLKMPLKQKEMLVIIRLRYEKNMHIFLITACYISSMEGIPLRAENYQQVELLRKYILKVNMKYNLGTHYLNHLDQFCFKLVLNLNPGQFRSIDSVKIAIDHLMKIARRTILQIFEYQCYKIMYSCGKQTIKLFTDQTFLAIKPGQRIIPPNVFEDLKIIKCLLEYNDIKKLPEKDQVCVHAGYNTTKKQLHPIIISPEDLAKIYSDIKSSTTQVHFGGFGKIQECRIKYTLDGKLQQRNLMVKSNTTKSNKVERELYILDQLVKNEKTKTSAFIGQYYVCENVSDLIFVESYPYRSLSAVLINKQISNFKKLQMMSQIGYAIKTLHDAEITHNDLKPANIVVHFDLVPKLIDFGESCMNEKIAKDEGISFPYGAPERVRDAKFPKEKQQSDIFSFGMIMYEFMFNTYPFEYDRVPRSQLEKIYRTCEYQIRKPYFNGNKTVMKLLYELTLKCMQPNPKVRPNIDIVIIILRKLLSIQDIIY